MSLTDVLLIISLLMPGLTMGYGFLQISKNNYVLGGLFVVSGLYSTIVFAGIKLIQLWGILA